MLGSIPILEISSNKILSFRNALRTAYVLICIHSECYEEVIPLYGGLDKSYSQPPATNMLCTLDNHRLLLRLFTSLRTVKTSYTPPNKRVSLLACYHLKNIPPPNHHIYPNPANTAANCPLSYFTYFPFPLSSASYRSQNLA